MVRRTKADAAPVQDERPEPTALERAEVQACTEREKGRRPAPRFTVKQQKKGNQVQVAPANVHPEVTNFRVMNAFGITSADLANCLVNQIFNSTRLQSSNEPVSMDNLNAALAAVAGIAPRDEAEAMLAAQMVGVHWLAMDLLRKANDRAQRTDAGTLAVKLLRTFPAQLEALKRYRSAGEQRVVVQHQHVNVTAEQAAVQVTGAAVPDPRGEGDGSIPKERAHAQADPAPLAHASVDPMPCPDPARDAVPAAGGEREGALPDARRS
jgi:hypothetical protein